MKQALGLIMLAGTLALAAGVAAQGQKPAAPARDRGKAAAQAQKTSPGAEAFHAAFERMKGLAGDWEGMAHSAGKEDKTPASVNYRLTGAGSTVVETLFPGTAHEMVTMYHKDGSDLVLTHYCSVGNQPHMKARKGSDPGKLTFDFAGGANIEPGRTMHMHSTTLSFVDEDHLQNEWVLYNGGQQAERKIFDLTRRK